ncbi:MAG: hypothetical protein OXR66_06705 [Candidatus Woesearchaeota archaeon]|nr:hypothetical protein [Candidatus Woesearchaeota archaeon]
MSVPEPQEDVVLDVAQGRPTGIDRAHMSRLGIETFEVPRTEQWIGGFRAYDLSRFIRAHYSSGEFVVRSHSDRFVNGPGFEVSINNSRDYRDKRVVASTELHDSIEGRVARLQDVPYSSEHTEYDGVDWEYFGPAGVEREMKTGQLTVSFEPGNEHELIRQFGIGSFELVRMNEGNHDGILYSHINPVLTLDRTAFSIRTDSHQHKYHDVVQGEVTGPGTAKMRYAAAVSTGSRHHEFDHARRLVHERFISQP